MRTDILKYQRIRDLREDKNLSQKDMAKLLNISQNTYSRYETGERGIPIEILSKIADILDTSVDFLINRIDDRLPYLKKD